jgi:hypothetical protein
LSSRRTASGFFPLGSFFIWEYTQLEPDKKSLLYSETLN